MHWPHEFIQNKIRYAHTDLIRIIQETVFLVQGVWFWQCNFSVYQSFPITE